MNFFYECYGIIIAFRKGTVSQVSDVADGPPVSCSNIEDQMPVGRC